MSGEAARLDEVPEPQVGSLLRKLEWALRQEPVEARGSIPFYRVDHGFLVAAMDFIRDVAGRHEESYRRAMHSPEGHSPEGHSPEGHSPEAHPSPAHPPRENGV